MPALPRLPPVFPAKIIGRDRDGELLARPLDWTDGDPPALLVHVGRRDRSPPGTGDHVLLKIDRASRARGVDHMRVRVLKILAKRPEQMLGVFRAGSSGGGRIVPVDRKALGREIDVARGQTAGAEDGELVAVEMARDGRLGLTSARVVERLGDVSSGKAASLIAIHAHNLPHVFPEAALAEAAAAKPASLKGREDWRDLPLVTIDPVDARDHDDAVHAAHDDDPANPGGFILSIAIADVAAYVSPGSALDNEALSRGNSVYFPDRVVPMLPERISNDLCSLLPGEDRPAMAARIVIDANGRKRSHAFHRVLMRSHARLAYEQAQNAIDGRPDDVAKPVLEPVLRPLYAAYAALAKARDAREPLALEVPERKLILDANNKVRDVVIRERLDAHRLIEEMMILANVCAAETLIAAKSPLLFRIHDEPSLAKMESLRAFLKTLEIELPRAGALRPSIFNRTLGRLADTEHAPLVNEVVLRSQAQAEYAPDNIGHFGLNLRNYAHFTSPIRRYADLIVHRALIKALNLGGDGLPDMGIERLRTVGQLVSATERRAMLAERDTYDRLIAAHLADRIGAKFAGRISGVTKSGLFVKLTLTGADGFVPASTLGADFYAFDEAAMALIGQRSGEGFRLGDPVEVRLVEAAPLAGALRFEILSRGRYMKPAGGKRSRRRRGDLDRAALRRNPGRASRGR